MAGNGLITPRGIEWSEPLPLVESQELVVRLNAGIAPVPFSPNTTVVRGAPLSFYEGGRLLALTELSTLSQMTKYALVGGGRAVVLDGSNAPIYQLNEDAPIRLTRARVGQYLRVFLSFVRGRHGYFRLVEDVTDLSDPVGGDESEREAIASAVHPLLLQPSDDDGPYELAGVLLFKDALFGTVITVQADGTVAMPEEDVLFENHPGTD